MTLTSSPPMMSIRASWSQACSQRGLNITLKPASPLPSSLLGTWGLTLSLSNTPSYRIPEGAVDTMKWRALSKCWRQLLPEELLFLSLGWEEGRDQRGRKGGILGTMRIINIQELKMGALSNLVSRESHGYNSRVSGKAFYHFPTLGWALEFQI